MNSGKSDLNIYLVDNSKHILRGHLLKCEEEYYYISLENGSKLWTSKYNVYFIFEDAFFSKVEAV